MRVNASGVVAFIQISAGAPAGSELGMSGESAIDGTGFSMALSLGLSEAGHRPRTIETRAQVHLRNVDGLPTIQQIDLEAEADVPGLDQGALRERAQVRE